MHGVNLSEARIQRYPKSFKSRYLFYVTGIGAFDKVRKNNGKLNDGALKKSFVPSCWNRKMILREPLLC